MGDTVTGGVIKVIELVGSSSSGFSDAVRNAVKVASQSVRHIQGVEALSSTAEVDERGELTTYKVQCKIAFLVEESMEGEGQPGEASAAVAASSSGAASARGTTPGATSTS